MVLHTFLWDCSSRTEWFVAPKIRDPSGGAVDSKLDTPAEGISAALSKLSRMSKMAKRQRVDEPLYREIMRYAESAEPVDSVRDWVEQHGFQFATKATKLLFPANAWRICTVEVRCQVLWEREDLMQHCNSHIAFVHGCEQA